MSGHTSGIREEPIREFCTGFWLEVAGLTHALSGPSS